MEIDKETIESEKETIEPEKEIKQPIEGKIANVFIVDEEHAIIINKGYEDGVKENMKFIIYELGKEIKDPETKQPLGFFEYIKGKVRITQVSQKYSVAKNDETKTVTVNQINIPFFGPQTKVVPKPMPIDDTDFESNIIRGKKIVIGDHVRQII